MICQVLLHTGFCKVLNKKLHKFSQKLRSLYHKSFRSGHLDHLEVLRKFEVIRSRRQEK